MTSPTAVFERSTSCANRTSCAASSSARIEGEPSAISSGYEPYPSRSLKARTPQNNSLRQYWPRDRDRQSRLAPSARLLMAERPDHGSGARTARVRRVAGIHLHDNDAHGVAGDRRARLHGAACREHAVPRQYCIWRRIIDVGVADRHSTAMRAADPNIGDHSTASWSLGGL